MHRSPPPAFPAPPSVGWGVLAPAIAFALVGGALALTAALLDLAGGDERGAGRPVAGLAGSGVESLAFALGIAALAATLGTTLGTPLGVALRSRPRAPWALALRAFAFLPLAAPPLVLALGLNRLVEAEDWLNARAAEALGDPLRVAIALVLAHLPTAIAIVAVVVSATGGGADAATLEAARLLGAGRVRRFLTFQLPGAVPAAWLGLALAFLLVATSVAALAALASGGAS